MDQSEEYNAIKQFKQLISEKDGLNINLEDDLIFQRYLYLENYSVEKAFERMHSYFNLKLKYPDFYPTRVEEIHYTILKRRISTVLSRKDSKGRQIYLVNTGIITYGEFKENFLSQVDEIWFQAILDDRDAIKNGIVILVDISNTKWNILRMLTPYNCRLASEKLDSIPVKNIEIHVINTGLILKAVLNIFYPFVSQRIKDRIVFHESVETLSKYIPVDCLPIDLNGECEKIDYDNNVEIFIKSKIKQITERLEYGYKNAE